MGGRGPRTLKKERPSFSSGRSWELSGGIMQCGCCGWAIATTTVSSEGLYYRFRKRSMYGKDICVTNKYRRAVFGRATGLGRRLRDTRRAREA
jgi:hypothetical protein